MESQVRVLRGWLFSFSPPILSLMILRLDELVLDLLKPKNPSANDAAERSAPSAPSSAPSAG
jgi:hypothetical protein